MAGTEIGKTYRHVRSDGAATVVGKATAKSTDPEGIKLPNGGFAPLDLTQLKLRSEHLDPQSGAEQGHDNRTYPDHELVELTPDELKALEPKPAAAAA